MVDMDVGCGTEKTTYRFATIGDVEFLAGNRMAFIEMPADDMHYAQTRSNAERFYRQGLASEHCAVILAERDGQGIGSAEVFFYNAPPSKFNTAGKNGYITGMFVAETHRRQGIATVMLNRLMDWAQDKGCGAVFLQESEMGRKLYEKYGFTPGKPGMLLKLADNR